MTDALGLPFAGEQVVRRISDSLAEPDWLRADRLAGLHRYSELPIEPNRLFTLYVDLRAARFADIVPYTETGAAGALAETVPEGADALIAVDEDRLVARALTPAAREAGVVVDTFANVLRTRPQLLREAIGAGDSLPADDKFAQFARAHAALGILVHVPAGVVVERPIVIRWSAGAAGRGLVARTVVSIGANAQASVLEEQLPSRAGEAAPAPAADEAQSLWWGTTELRLADGARLDFAGQQDFGPRTLVFVNRDARLERDSHLRWALASVGGLLHKSRIDNRLEGRGATVQQAEIGFGSGSQLFDLTSYTRHIGEDTTGDLLSKGIFADRSRGYFKGLIEIQRTARGTDSFLGEFAMLLTRKARSIAIPSLEIDQPDVRRASHASAVGPIDEAQVFYLMSRGLPRELARKFIVLGFLEPVVARIPLVEAQDRLRQLLDAKWPAEAGQAAA
ncbi:MAG TPA: SufD family Fe-S cluster assembly protein [Candidatus Limnocylindria bacterium]|nr:SufD family Fe-S cluster assembly protein [Candidatus Limnocylindria bacterium]